MSYKKKEKISLLLYYDYLEQFEMLDDQQFRKLIYAMIDFDKNEIEPELDKMTKMAFLPIKRRLKQDKKAWEEMCRKNSENVRKRWEKDNTSEYNGIRLNTNAYERIPKDTKNTDIDIEIEKDIEIENERERENNILSCTPTLSEILSFGKSKNVDEEYCKNFYNHYEAIGWVNGTGQQIKNWKLVFENWIKKDIKINNKQEKIDEAGFIHRNGRRIL